MMILLGFIFLAATTPSILTNFTNLLMDSFAAIRELLAVK
jgi:flagellar biosynthesis protein FliR